MRRTVPARGVRLAVIRRMPVLAIQCVEPACNGGVETPTPVSSPSGPGESVEWGGDEISCTDDVMADQGRHIEVLIEVKRRCQQKLSKIPGVVGVGAGYAIRNGRKTRELAIRVGITPEAIEAETDSRDLVPLSIEGCKVSVYLSNPEPVGS